MNDTTTPQASESEDQFTTFSIIHGDDLEIFVNQSGMVSIKAIDFGNEETIIVIDISDVDLVCDMLKSAKAEAMQ